MTDKKKKPRKKKPSKIRVKVKQEGASIIIDALRYAVERGMNRCDKYHVLALTESQRNLLEVEISNSFWLALDDAGAEIV